MKPYLSVFLTNGNTLRFEDVTGLEQHGYEVSFFYTSASTGKRMKAKFQVTLIAGYSEAID